MNRLCLLFILLLVACGQRAPTDRPAPLPGEAEPPPASTPNARWSDPATWGGSLPVAGQDVNIPEDKKILLDISPPALGGVTVEGALIFGESDLSLSAEWILVKGSLEIGSSTQPFTHRATVTLTGPDEDIRGMGGKFLVAAPGGLISLHGETRTSWTRLARTLAQGDTALELAEAADWRVGDRIVVASSDFDFRQAETFEIVGVSDRMLSLDRPAAYTHWGEPERYAGRSLDMRAEVGLLSRNVRVQGDAVSELAGFGGHLMAMSGGALYVSGAELYRMGQRGKMGRYPAHWHMMGDAARGQFVRGSSVHRSFNRCVTLHGSHGVFIRDNVAFDAPGHCFFLEDGAETDNVLEGNLGLGIYRPEPADALLASDLDHRGPATYWLTNPDNRVRANVSAGSQGTGFWFALPEHPTGPSATEAVWPRFTPLASFEDNVAHSSGADGLHVDSGPKASGDLETSYYRPSRDPGAVEDKGGRAQNTSEPVTASFEAFTAYKNRNRGVWLRGAHHRLEGAILADNAIGATFASQDTEVTASLFVGESGNKGTPEAWMLPDGVGPDGRTLPKPWAADFPIRGFEFYDGPVAVRDSHFARFVPNAQRGASALSYLRFTSFSVDPDNSASALSFENDGTQRVYLERAAGSLPEDPTSDSEDGYRSAVFKDDDGSVTGQAGHYVVVDNPFLLGACRERPTWVAWVCEERYVALSVQTEGQLASLTLSRDDGERHTLFGAGASPSERFRTLLLPQRGYRLEFAGARPQSFRAVLQAGAGTSLQLAIPFDDALPLVSRYGREQAPVADLAALSGASSSSHYYDGASGTLYVKLVAESDYEALEVADGGPAPPLTGSGTGLTGSYFDSRDFSGEPLVRLDPVINFDWDASPIAGVGEDNFSVRWSGSVEATEAGKYTFTTVTDDGVRLEVCGHVLFDDDTYHGPQPNSAVLELAAGQRCTLTMAFFEGGGGAFAQLWWQYGPYARHLVPQRQLYPD